MINIPGCPPNPHNFLATVAYILTYKKLPAMDKLNRPLFAYDRLIHENCYRRPHFDAGRLPKSTAIMVTEMVGVCIILVVKGRKLTATALP